MKVKWEQHKDQPLEEKSEKLSKLEIEAQGLEPMKFKAYFAEYIY